MKKYVLIIGVRRQCYKAALELGHDVILWSDGKLNNSRKKGLLGWIEEPYSESLVNLSPKVIDKLQKYEIQRVIANTEETVILGAHVRELFKLKRLAVDVTQRFHDKLVMKNFASKHNIPITKYKFIEANTTAKSLVDYLKLPLVIKPIDESGAQDIKIAKTMTDVEKYLLPGALAESFVEGSEVSVETFVQDGKAIFHNITEYLHQWRKSVVPAKLEKQLQEKILEINDKVIEKFGVDRGMTHAEFYLTQNGPVFGEIAIRPPGGYYMDLIQKVYGFNSWQLYINLSCGDALADFDPSINGCAGVYIIHPGPGKILSIKGVDEIQDKLKGVFDISIRKQVGDTILEHENTSNEIGHILFWAPNREQLDLDLNFIENTLIIETSKDWE